MSRYLLWSLCKGWFLWSRSLGYGSIFCPPLFNLQLEVQASQLLRSCSWLGWESGCLCQLGRDKPAPGASQGCSSFPRPPKQYPGVSHGSTDGGRGSLCGSSTGGSSPRWAVLSWAPAPAPSWEPRARLGHWAGLPRAELSCLGLGVVTFSCGFTLFQSLYCINLYLPAPQTPRDSLGASQRSSAVPRGRATRGHCSGGRGRRGWQLQRGAAQLVLTMLCQTATKEFQQTWPWGGPEFSCRFFSMESYTNGFSSYSSVVNGLVFPASFLASFPSQQRQCC